MTHMDAYVGGGGGRLPSQVPGPLAHSTGRPNPQVKVEGLPIRLDGGPEGKPSTSS